MGILLKRESDKPVQAVMYHRRSEKCHCTAQQNKPSTTENAVKSGIIVSVGRNYACHEEYKAGEQIYNHRQHRNAVGCLGAEMPCDNIHTHKG